MMQWTKIHGEGWLERSTLLYSEVKIVGRRVGVNSWNEYQMRIKQMTGCRVVRDNY